MDKYKKDIEEYEKVTREQEAQNAALINKNYDAAIKQAEQSVATQKAEAEQAYADSILQADIQKELDLRDIREARANMGLSRSGLSATEQTAAILSAGNKAAKADRQRLAAIDALNQSLNEYRNQANLEREGKLLTNQQTATEQIRSYTEGKNTQAENDRRTSLSSLGLDSEMLSRALNEGWTVEQATAAKTEKAAARIAALDAAYTSGQISEAVLLQAKANGLTVDDALVLERSQQLANKESVVESALEFLGKGYIDLNTYRRAENGEIGIAELTNLARQNAAKAATTTTTTDWTSALNKLLDKEYIDGITHAIAIKNKWDPQQAVEYYNQQQQSASAVEEGKITEGERRLSTELSIPTSRTIELSKYAQTAKGMIKTYTMNTAGKTEVKRASSSVYDAIDYIYQNAKSVEDVAFMLETAGITQKEIDAYNQVAEANKRR